ncbi:MAG: TIM barrel protein [Planctomycetota bacterium]
MIRPGLASVTFRDLAVPEVCRLAADHGMEGIEWAADRHAPPGQLQHARRLARLSHEHRLHAAAYGTYYRLGVTEPRAWAGILDTAEALGTAVLRVWCGDLGSHAAGPYDRQRVVDDARRAADLAQRRGMTMACEWHGGTLTDTPASAQNLFEAVDHPAFQTYWQPRARVPHPTCLADLQTALPRLIGLHVFHWHPATAQRLPLALGEDNWRAYLQQARSHLSVHAPEPRYALLEFVKNDDPAQFAHDAETLHRLLRHTNPQTR